METGAIGRSRGHSMGYGMKNGIKGLKKP